MSPERVRLPRGVVALRPAAVAEEVQVQPVSLPQDAGPRAGIAKDAVKALQVHAYERGRSVEKSESGALLQAAAAKLEECVTGLRAAQQRELEAAEVFARRLAVVAITELTGAVIARDSHEVRTLVRRILDDALGGQQAGDVQLAGHPEDLARLPKDFSASFTGVAVKLVPDPELARGSFRVHAEGAEFLSDLAHRLNLVQERLLRETPHAG